MALTPFARRLRRKSTDAEKRLWRALRDRRCRGHKFRRQHPVPPYVLDFYCEELKLAIELDGSGHGVEDQKAHDERRTQFLERQGIRVIRFRNYSLLVEGSRLTEWLWREVEKMEGELG
jgi:very-short-patch-repair endonuclease